MGDSLSYLDNLLLRYNILPSQFTCIWGFLRVLVSKLISQPRQSSKEQRHLASKDRTSHGILYKFE